MHYRLYLSWKHWPWRLFLV